MPWQPARSVLEQIFGDVESIKRRDAWRRPSSVVDMDDLPWASICQGAHGAETTSECRRQGPTWWGTLGQCD
jgi:hypothetical protein